MWPRWPQPIKSLWKCQESSQIASIVALIASGAVNENFTKDKNVALPRVRLNWLIWATFLLSTVIVIGSAMVGGASSCKHQVGGWESLCRGDGVHYVAIAATGYSYHHGSPCNVAFFPAYPLSVRALASIGFVEDRAAVIVALAFFTFAACLFEYYASLRSNSPPWRSTILFLIFPMTFFFRMAYSESMFLTSVLVFLIAVRWQANPLIVSAIAGVASGIRPVGIALAAPAIIYAWSCRADRSTLRFVSQLVSVALLSVWGLLLYAWFLGASFGEPLSFATTQRHFRMRPEVGTWSVLSAYLNWEPIWSVFRADSPAYWRSQHDAASLVRALNPISWLVFVALVVWGGIKGHLSKYEFILSLGLLMIPYLTRGYDMCMVSQGRFAAACVPAYYVFADLMERASPTAFLVVAITFLGLLSAFSYWFGAGLPVL